MNKPSPVTTAELIRTIRQWLSDNPDERRAQRDYMSDALTGAVLMFAIFFLIAIS